MQRGVGDICQFINHLGDGLASGEPRVAAQNSPDLVKRLPLREGKPLIAHPRLVHACNKYRE